MIIFYLGYSTPVMTLHWILKTIVEGMLIYYGFSISYQHPPTTLRHPNYHLMETRRP